MKPLLSPDAIERRREKNKKIFKIILIFAAIGVAFAIFVPTDEDRAKQSEKKIDYKVKLDSAIQYIKQDDLAKIKSVEYTSDSIIKITISNKPKNISAQYYAGMYNIDSLPNVADIELYRSNELISTYGKRTGKKIDAFKHNFVDPSDGSCLPLIEYIKKSMNDPDSFVHDKTVINFIVNGTFEVHCSFRGKNAFGGVVRNEVKAIIDQNGNIIKIE